MRVAVATPGRFHSFDLATELQTRGLLSHIYTGYPRFRLKGETLPARFIKSHAVCHAPVMASLRMPAQNLLRPLQHELFNMCAEEFDRWVSQNLDDADILIALSGSGTRSGAEIQRRGGAHICDRGSTHISWQQRILTEEAHTLNLRPRLAHRGAVQRELREYATADLIFTPSHFTLDSFLREGVAEEKMRLIPYGVNLEQFYPQESKSETFTVLFAGQTVYRKGLHYLLRAWKLWANPEARLVIAGGISSEFGALLEWVGGLPPGVDLLGHVTKQKLRELMSKSHALVMPSLEEGLALVMAQAMACGTSVIATHNSGAATLFSHEREGLIGDARSCDFLVDSLKYAFESPSALTRMSTAALTRSRSFGSKARYGDDVQAALEAFGSRNPKSLR